ncbi:MAG: anion permease [Solobacterium sp.]|nr:anion permease [Solobacterium sp.]
MNTQLLICLIIFVATLVSFLLNKIPMWLTSMISLSALFITGCIDAGGALAGFSNTNTILMATMFVVAAGFRRTSLVDSMCSGILKLTKGSFRLAFLGYLILTALLSNFIASPMVVYAIVSPLVCALCDKAGVSRSLYIFPLMVTAIATCGILPGPTAIQMSGQFTGFMETYGFTGMAFAPTNFFIGEWPVIIVVIAWAMLLSGKFLPAETEIAVKEKKQASSAAQVSGIANTAGIIIFFATIAVLIFSAQLKLQTWWVALVGSLLMVLFGVVDQKNALRDIPWDMILLYVGALGLGTALTNTGAGEMIGSALANMVGGTHNNYILGALFFIIPFLMTQVMLNRAVSAVFVPICLLTCSALGANPIGLIMLVNAGSLTAFMTPMATPAVPMAMGDGGYELSDLLKGGWLISILLALVYIVYTMTVFPAF